MVDRKQLAVDFANSLKLHPEIEKVILFGSVARGDDTENSDIDILIVSSHKEELFDIIYDKIYEILINHEELISAHFVDEEKFENEKDFLFLSNVVKEGVVLAG